MTSLGATVERQGQCWRCTERVGLSPFCLSCAAPQPLAPASDHFAILGLPRRLDVDAADLERRYHEASRRVHPDRHQTASEAERELSLTASAALNRAYRTLRDPIGRGRYWLELHGSPLGADNNRVPPELAMLVFEVQEQLADARAGHLDRAAVETTRHVLAERSGRLVAGLEARFAAQGSAADAPALAALKTTLSEIAYLRTLLRDVDAALAG